MERHDQASNAGGPSESSERRPTGSTNGTHAPPHDLDGSDKFARVPERLVYADVTDRAVRVYCVLDRHAGSDGECFPSRQTIARRLGCRSVDSVDRAIDELVDGGFIVKRKRAGKGAVNVYQVAAYLRPPRPPGSRISAAPVAPDMRHRTRAKNESQQQPHLARVINDAAERFADDEVRRKAERGDAITNPSGLRRHIESQFRSEHEAGALMLLHDDDLSPLDLLRALEPDLYPPPQGAKSFEPVEQLPSSSAEQTANGLARARAAIREPSPTDRGGERP